jgi:chromosomal replication initiation ATPase DnaA
VYDAVLGHFGVPPEALSRKGDRNEVRAVAAYLARRWTDITLRELAGELGLSRAESVPNLTRRVERQREGRSRIGKSVSEIERDLESRMKKDPLQSGGVGSTRRPLDDRSALTYDRLWSGSEG